MTTLAEFLSLPMGSQGPSNDRVVAVDELGRHVYETPRGERYVLNERERSTPQDRRNALVEAVQNPVETGRNALGAIWQGAVNALTAPGRAARGESLTYGDVADTAGMAQLGGAAMPAPKGSLRIFAGRNAKNADLDGLTRAQRLAADGADRGAIWNDTGWFQGVDGQWRFEIDDSGAGLSLSLIHI